MNTKLSLSTYATIEASVEPVILHLEHIWLASLHSQTKQQSIMATSISNPTIVSSNTDPAPKNVKPATASDGKFTWSVVGQNDTLITFQVASAKLTNPSIKTGALSVDAVADGKAGFVQVTAAFTNPSDKDNWTIKVGTSGGSGQTFQKGSGVGH